MQGPPRLESAAGACSPSSYSQSSILSSCAASAVRCFSVLTDATMLSSSTCRGVGCWLVTFLCVYDTLVLCKRPWHEQQLRMEALVRETAADEVAQSLSVRTYDVTCSVVESLCGSGMTAPAMVYVMQGGTLSPHAPADARTRERVARMYDSSSFFAAAASRLSSSARRSRSITAREACKWSKWLIAGGSALRLRCVS